MFDNSNQSEKCIKRNTTLIAQYGQHLLKDINKVYVL